MTLREVLWYRTEQYVLDPSERNRVMLLWILRVVAR